MAEIILPPVIEGALDNGATLAISISGGKDSQALERALRPLRARYSASQVFLIHADLGKMEWKETPAHVELMAEEAELPLVIVHREQGDLLDHMQYRMEQLKGQNKPHFPSSSARYCTSDHKRTPIDKHLRQFDLVISAEGVRASESAARAKKPAYELRQQICTRTRTAYNWRPLFHWSDEDIWEILGSSQRDIDKRRLLYACGQHAAAFDGWQAHPAYVMGNQRLSCAICVLGSRNDIKNGIKHNPELHRAIVAMEQESGFSFRKDLALGDFN